MQNKFGHLQLYLQVGLLLFSKNVCLIQTKTKIPLFLQTKLSP